MSQRKKLLERLCTKPKNFTWQELKQVLEGFGYIEQPGSGSRRKFIKAAEGSLAIISLHEPHPGNELKAYQVKEVIEHLKQEKLL